MCVYIIHHDHALLFTGQQDTLLWKLSSDERYKKIMKSFLPIISLKISKRSIHSSKKSLRWPVEVETIVLCKKRRVYLSDSNRIWSPNHLVCKRTLKHLSLPLPLRSCELWMFVKEIPDIKKHISENNHSKKLNMLHTLEVIIKMKCWKQIKLSKKMFFSTFHRKWKNRHICFKLIFISDVKFYSKLTAVAN